MYRFALLLPLLAVAQNDPDMPAAAIAKKLSAVAKLSELSLRPLTTAPDDVRLRFFAKYDDVKLTDDNRLPFLAGVVARKDSSDAVKVAAIGWLGKLPESKVAAKRTGRSPRRQERRAPDGRHPGARRPQGPGDRAPTREALVRSGSRDPQGGRHRSGRWTGDQKATSPRSWAAYKKFKTGGEDDVRYGEALAMLGEEEVSLKIAPLGLKSRDFATREAAVHTLECVPSMKVIPVIMDNLILELRRTISLDPKKPDWDRLYVSMCSELQRRTGKDSGLDACAWIDWWEGVRAQYGAPAPAFERARVERWMDDYRKMGPSKIKE